MPSPAAPSLTEIPQWRTFPTLTIPQYAAVFGCSSAAAYAAVRRGEVPTITVGKRKRIPTLVVRRMLGEVADVPTGDAA